MLLAPNTVSNIKITHGKYAALNYKKGKPIRISSCMGFRLHQRYRNAIVSESDIYANRKYTPIEFKPMQDRNRKYIKSPECPNDDVSKLWL